MNYATNSSGKGYRFCDLGERVDCDGLGHFYAVWDEELRRSIPVDGSCPHRDHNREVIAAERAHQ